jgi:hypothetical protein
VNDERRQRVARRAALLGGAGVVACLAIAVLVIAARPRQFTTHRDAIGYDLARRDIAYAAIYINRTWPDTLTSEYYGANLEVQLPSGRSVPGRIECRSGRTQCRFSLATLGIVRAPLPELVAEAEKPAWQRWLEETVQRLRFSTT